MLNTVEDETLTVADEGGKLRVADTEGQIAL
jgi:hypothetical protein